VQRRADPARVLHREPVLDSAPREPHPRDLDLLGALPGWPDRAREALAAWGIGRVAAGAAVAVVVAVVAGTAVLRGPAPPPPELSLPVAGGPGDPAASTTASVAVTAPSEVVVHAAGAVARPGVYRLASGARVADLLDAAGGPVGDADLDRLNLAAPLEDGGRVFVPVAGAEVPPVAEGAGGDPADGGDGSGAPDGPVDLNTATLDELDTLPGVGPTTAQAIIDERARRGRFRSVEDLLDVRGIGEAKLAALRDLVTV
jgi:competence protein ComEA